MTNQSPNRKRAKRILKNFYYKAHEYSHIDGRLVSVRYYTDWTDCYTDLGYSEVPIRDLINFGKFKERGKYAGGEKYLKVFKVKLPHGIVENNDTFVVNPRTTFPAVYHTPMDSIVKLQDEINNYKVYNGSPLSA